MTNAAELATTEMSTARDELLGKLSACSDRCTGVDAFLLSEHYHRMRDFGLLEVLMSQAVTSTRRCTGPENCILRQMIE